MTELIDKGALLERMERTEKEAELVLVSPSWWSALHIVRQAPTVTEAEIRTKAFSDLMDKIHEVLGASDRDIYCKEIIEEIAGQLKGNEE